VDYKFWYVSLSTTDVRAESKVVQWHRKSVLNVDGWLVHAVIIIRIVHRNLTTCAQVFGPHWCVPSPLTGRHPSTLTTLFSKQPMLFHNGPWTASDSVEIREPLILFLFSSDGELTHAGKSRNWVTDLRPP
jgi:hypothetical protein